MRRLTLADSENALLYVRVRLSGVRGHPGDSLLRGGGGSHEYFPATSKLL